MNFAKLIGPLSRYYTLEDAQSAIQTLEAFYKDEEYDNDDITADWSADAYEDSAGIEILAEAFHITDSEQIKILFQRCCHHLHSNSGDANVVKEDSTLLFQLTSDEKQIEEVKSLVNICYEVFNLHFISPLCKSWDISNKFPLLMSMFDSYNRFRIKNMKHYRISDWFKDPDNNTKRLTSTSKENAQFYADALNYFSRLFNYLELDTNIINHRISDSFDVFCNYAISIHRFIHSITHSSQVSEKYLPFQFDFLIIPMSVSLWSQPSAIDWDELNKLIPSFKVSNSQEKKTKYINFPKAGYSFEQKDKEAKCFVWDIEKDILKPNGYKKDKDYFGPFLIKKTDIKHINKILYEQIFMNHIQNVMQHGYQRYVVIIDRRNPKSLKERKTSCYVKENNKTWNDRIYLIYPKQYYKIKEKYESGYDYLYRMNELFLYHTNEYIIPHIEGCSGHNGYKFILSYHIYAKEIVKTYYYYHIGSTRFFLNDIQRLWTRYFVKIDDQFQSMSKNTKQELQKTLSDYKLLDVSFTTYMNGN